MISRRASGCATRVGNKSRAWTAKTSHGSRAIVSAVRPLPSKAAISPLRSPAPRKFSTTSFASVVVFTTLARPDNMTIKLSPGSPRRHMTSYLAKRFVWPLPINRSRAASGKPPKKVFARKNGRTLAASSSEALDRAGSLFIANRHGVSCTLRSVVDVLHHTRGKLALSSTAKSAQEALVNTAERGQRCPTPDPLCREAAGRRAGCNGGAPSFPLGRSRKGSTPAREPHDRDRQGDPGEPWNKATGSSQLRPDRWPNPAGKAKGVTRAIWQPFFHLADAEIDVRSPRHALVAYLALCSGHEREPRSSSRTFY